MPGTGAAPDLEQAAAVAAAEHAEERALVRRTRERYAAVQALRAQGKGIKPIMRELHLAKETVRKFARAATVEDLLARPRAGRASILDEHKPRLHKRWNAGCTNVPQLHAEITARGYRGRPRQLRHGESLPAALPRARRGAADRASSPEGP